MKSLKAIAFGSLFIIVIGLILQLAYIFLAVGYINLARSYPFLNDITVYLRYFIGVPVFLLIMFLGGYITADVVQKKVILHCSVVAVITVGTMTASALENAELTWSGLVVFVLAMLTTIAGGWYRQREIRLAAA